jgi:hypothetical protein
VGLKGTLTVAGDFNGFEMSACVEGVEGVANPQPVIHSFRLWIPPIKTK